VAAAAAAAAAAAVVVVATMAMAVAVAVAGAEAEAEAEAEAAKEGKQITHLGELIAHRGACWRSLRKLILNTSRRTQRKLYGTMHSRARWQQV